MTTYEELKALAAQTSVATVTDVLTPKAHRPVILGLKSTQPSKQLFGQAVTMRSLPAREDIMADTQKRFEDKVPNGDPMFYAMSLCGPGKVLVIDSSGYTDSAIGGDMKFGYFDSIGGEGLVTDGSIRDQREFEEQFSFPAFVSGCTPLGGTGRVLYGHDVNVDVSVAGALVRPGDYILGDEDGIVVIPEAIIEQTLNNGVAMEKFAVYFRQKSQREKVTYADILADQEGFVKELFENVDLTDAQKAYFG